MTGIQQKIIVGLGMAAFAAATWFAFQAPTQPALPVAANESSTASGILAAAGTAIANSSKAVGSPKTQLPIKYIRVAFTSPTSSAAWTIGEQHVIQWNKATGAVGELYLVNATSGTIAGWIQQNIAPTQNYFIWDARKIFVSATSAFGKNVLPGKYMIKISFDSPEAIGAESEPFLITASATTTE